MANERCPECGALDPMGDEDAWHKEGCSLTKSAQLPVGEFSHRFAVSRAKYVGRLQGFFVGYALMALIWVPAVVL